MSDGVPRPVALVVHDDEGVRESFRLVLDQDYDVLDAADGTRALEIVRSHHVDVVLLDIRLPEMDGIEILERLKALDESLEVILVTAVKTVRMAVAAMKLGAFDYVTKPFEDEDLRSIVRRAVEKRSLEREVTFLRGELARSRARDEIIGEHPEMLKLARLVKQVARTTTTVLISGESGTGKELIARAIHRHGPRCDKPFVPVNPAAVPEALVESELFGHEKGAYTGAHVQRKGKLEQASGGTVFLDEIGEMSMPLQVKLLRFLQERQVERLGGHQTIHVDTRVIAATNKELKAEIAAGRFREDLYFRLSVVIITLPPLRDRGEDIGMLANTFLRRNCQQYRRRLQFSPDALTAIAQYPWPGNIRELQNAIQRASILARGRFIEPADLGIAPAIAPPRTSLREARNRVERQVVVDALIRTRGNISRAASELEISRPALHDLLEKHQIDSKELRSAGVTT